MRRLDGDLFTRQLRDRILEDTTRYLQNTRTALLEALDLLEEHEIETGRVEELRVILEDGEVGIPTVAEPRVDLVELTNSGPIPLFILDGDKK